MADGGLHIEIEEPLAEQVLAAARALGVSPDEFVASLVAQQLVALDDFEIKADLDPTIDMRIAEDAMASGDLVPAEEVVRWMRSWFTADEVPAPERPTR